MSGAQKRSFTLHWIWAVTIGESLGFAVAAMVAIAVTLAGQALNAWVAYALVVAGGALEGVLLGLSQRWAAGPQKLGPAWVVATGLGAALAWALGMLPSTLGMDVLNPLGMTAVATGGLVLLASIPTAQWMTLRRRHTVRWIPVTMGAWAVAILWTAAPSPIIDERTPVPLIALAYLGAGLLMAVTIAALTAHTAASLFPPETTWRRDFRPDRTPHGTVRSQP